MPAPRARGATQCVSVGGDPPDKGGISVCKFGGDTDNCFISGAVAVLCYHVHVCILTIEA